MKNFESKPEAYNFKTASYEAVDMKELPVERLREFMPQDDTVQTIFTLHLELDEPPLKAYLKTMEAVAASFKDT